MNEKEVREARFRLAKILHDARSKSCYMGDSIERECDKFPADLKAHQYVHPKPCIDIALDQAQAVMKYINLDLLKGEG